MKICAKESNIYRVFSRYESHRDRYSAGLVQFSDTINKILYNVNNVMNNINSSNSYKTDLLIDSLIQICFFQLDSVDLLNIVSLINNHKYKKLATIKTTMCETNTLGISQIIYYEVACDHAFNCNNKHYYSPLELQKLIDDKRIFLIRKLFSNEIRYGNYEVNFHTFIINDYYHQLFEGFYEEYNYYLNNISNNEKLFFREYVNSIKKKY